MADVPLQVVSENSVSERRITPSWTIGQLKARLEPITGVPPLSQKLSLKVKGQDKIAIEAVDEENTRLDRFTLTPYAELHVDDLRPPGARENYTDVSGVDKYVMPEDEYEKKTDSVLAWKKNQKLGRFDPNAPDHEQAKLDALAREVAQRDIAVGKRCRVGANDDRRGEVRYVGEVKEIPGGAGPWIGVQLDEPVGKNDGSIAGTRYWGQESTLKHGVFVRPDRVEVGDFPAINDLEDMEEI
ncbi:tubulin-specific chaperone B [Geosmithia morbida]|uniref:Tubulin-specific chaperone B n=1 Tax=Geosmithia morbida TaxID=1094350 RepID=A0A9P4YY20_9HYPO|nr:tubulin-specific chaperone B [Geosmithia morbida]KAF4123851.1 tubulin-specific chaperone B [Geosmithia morbida]